LTDQQQEIQTNQTPDENEYPVEDRLGLQITPKNDGDWVSIVK